MIEPGSRRMASPMLATEDPLRKNPSRLRFGFGGDVGDDASGDEGNGVGRDEEGD